MFMSPKPTFVASLLLIVVSLALVSGAYAREITQFADTRFIAPLPGSLFGVMPDGKVGFDGAMNITVPTAYTPGAGNIVLSPNAGSNRKNRLPDQLDGTDVNGSFVPGLGLTIQGHHVYFADMATSKDIETLIGLQVELWPQTDRRPAIAVGVSDLLAARGPASDPHSSRSVYAVATWELTNASVPTYVTVGWGNRRYNSRPIAAVSIQPARNFKLAAEYDGLGANLAASYRVWSDESNRWNAMVYGQYQNLGFPGLGFMVTHSR